MRRLIWLVFAALVGVPLFAQTKAAVKVKPAPRKPVAAAVAKPAPAEVRPNVLMDRIGGTAFIRLDAESVKSLTPQQQALAYWLSQAAIATDPIIYDQLSAQGFQVKRLLEGILAFPEGIRGEILDKIRTYAKLYWANRGNHNLTTSQKFLPEFTQFEFEVATETAQQNGAYRTASGDLPALATQKELAMQVNEAAQSIFDPYAQMMVTAKTPGVNEDILQASSNTFYRRVKLVDLNGFKEEHPLNSRLIKNVDDKLRELVYRAGTPDGSVAPGLYATYLKKAIECLEKARMYADPKQATAIADLIRYFQSGDPAEWLKFGEDWVQADSTVDFDNGFIEIYRDARGAKGSSQSFVTVTDKPLTEKMTKLGQNAAYFEQKAPWSVQYKRQSFKLPVVKAVETVIETGDFHANTIGDNLPNENQIREKFGSKNFLFTGSARAIRDASGSSAELEFATSPDMVARDAKYGAEAMDLNTAMHEIIGHGSGKLTEKMKNGSEPYLKEYYSTMEEARADLMALWNVWDPKLKELGLISNQLEVAKTLYDSATLTAIQQLRRIPKGNTIEEDHQRNRQLIIRYIQDKVPGSIEQFDKDGKTYIRVVDYQKMRKGVGMLLAELMRIKAEGDYVAIKALVDKYAVHFDPALRDQVIERYAKLNLPVYWAGINSTLTPDAGSGEISGVKVTYPSTPEEQYLNYAAMYDQSIAEKIGKGK